MMGNHVVSQPAETAAPRQRLAQLKRALLDLMFAGCRKVPGGASVKIRDLTPQERATIEALNLEVRSIERNLRRQSA